MEYYSSIKKNEIMTLYSNMDETGDYHTEWNKSDRKRQASYDIIYKRNLKNDTNLFIKQEDSQS